MCMLVFSTNSTYGSQTHLQSIQDALVCWTPKRNRERIRKYKYLINNNNIHFEIRKTHKRSFQSSVLENAHLVLSTPYCEDVHTFLGGVL